MRTHGTLTKWNDDRGFGFITVAQGAEEVFVHISAFPSDGRRPQPGELISFEIEKDGRGKPRAIRVMRAGRREKSRESVRSARPQRASGFVSAVVSLLAIAAIGAYAYSRIRDRAQPEAIAPVPATSLSQPVASPGFKCDGRTTCSQMTSCAEARYFLQHCPNTTMDGNHDGDPCERQWCN